MRGEWGHADFSAFLDARMREEGIRNDAELARLGGINQTQISNWRRGLARPSVDSLDKIAPALKVSSGALYERAGYLAERDPTGPDFAMLPRELRELVEVYSDPRLTDDDRRVLRQSVRLFLAGFMAGINEREAKAKAPKRPPRGRSAA